MKNEIAEILREAASFIDSLPGKVQVAQKLRFPMLDEMEGFALMLENEESESPSERKEPWASCCTVAINRAIRKFREEFPTEQGTMSAVTENEDGDTYFISVTGLIDNFTARYSFESLGIEMEDLFVP